MSETTTETTAGTETDTADKATEDSKDTGAATATETDSEKKADGEDALGDAGKKALDAMKAERKAARDAHASEKARADALQAKLDGKEAEHTAAQEKAATEKAALDKANGRILRSEVKAAAKGVLADPTDAFLHLDLDSFEVSDDGDVDEEAIAAALKELVSKKSYLAVQDGKRFQGDGDGGTRKESAVSQLSKADVERLAAAGKHAEIEKARTEGRLNDLLGIK